MLKCSRSKDLQQKHLRPPLICINYKVKLHQPPISREFVSWLDYIVDTNFFYKD